jgi:hypothetical protein
MPFRTRPGQPRDLLALVDQEVRERIEEAVDYVSLEVLVESRRQRGLPPPAADSASDRRQFEAGVRALLERLRADIAPALAPERRRKAEEAAGRAGDDPLAALVSLQVALARELPDYWQRFERVRLAYTADQTAGAGEPGLLRRLFLH